MTLQQLEYVVALAKYGHFSETAYALDITQPTLSATIAKLEAELDVSIFDRSRHPIVPTAIGQTIVDQAKLALTEVRRVAELASEEKSSVRGEVKIGVIPTIAPYIVPRFFTLQKQMFPELSVSIFEMPTSQQVPALKRGELDISVLATHHEDPEFLEVPIYREKLIVYASQGHPYLESRNLKRDMLFGDDLWLLRSEHCLSTQILDICHLKGEHRACYTAGNIYTLINIVDAQGGYTIIPELHVGMLSAEQLTRVRRFEGQEPERTVSLYIRSDYFREGMLNAVAQCICGQIPADKVDPAAVSGQIRI